MLGVEPEISGTRGQEMSNLRLFSISNTLPILPGLFVTSYGQGIGCVSSDWQLSGDTCYYVDTSTTQTWDLANQRCQTLGGPLARLASIYR